ncbi:MULTISPECIES: hypothetical protein [unclassified Actinotalea]|nr:MULTISPECIES: hypothetical protein [unclassified Actinotalea]
MPAHADIVGHVVGRGTHQGYGIMAAWVVVLLAVAAVLRGRRDA